MPISPADCFASDYATARAAFLEACAGAGAALEAHRHPLPGPDGEPLFLDVARLGAPGARRVTFVASGTHGVEGLCGSGIQTWLLRTGRLAQRPDDVAVVLVHAVNPWGFAFERRVNEDNVDLNRNFLEHGGTYPENPDYDRLFDALHPERLDEESVAASLATIRAFEAEAGSAAMYRAVSGGQYVHPRGLQYGGREPTWSNRTLRAVWAEHAAGAELAAYVDLHSGLGPCGVGLLFQTAAASSPAARLASALWPDVIRAEPAAGADAALVTGLVGPAFVAALPEAVAVGLVLEYGTRDTTHVMLALQADHWLDRHGRRDSPEGRAIRQRMREAFFLDDVDWKEKVCTRAGEVVEPMLSRLATLAPEALR